MGLTSHISCVYDDFSSYCFSFLWLTGISIIRRIIFLRWWVWRWWIWIQVPWYVRFSILLWQLRWPCQWHRLWRFCSDWNRVNWRRCSVGCVCTKRSRVQSWLTHRIILATKILIYHFISPSFKFTLKIIVVLCLRHDHSIRCSFTNIMARRYPVGDIRWPSNSGSGEKYGPVMLTGYIQKPMKFGLSERKVSLPKFIRPRA